jgi:hypothetical protein
VNKTTTLGYGLGKITLSASWHRFGGQALDELISRHSQTDAYQIAVAYAWRGETGKAFEWLDRSYAQHDSGLLWLKIDPFLNRIRTDARYSAMLKKMNLHR